jgi:hypothetical protein
MILEKALLLTLNSMQNDRNYPPEFPKDKELGNSYEITDLEEEAIDPVTPDDRKGIFLQLIKDYKEMEVAKYSQDELDIQRQKILEEWNELDRTIPQNDPSREMIEKEMEKLDL